MRFSASTAKTRPRVGIEAELNRRNTLISISPLNEYLRSHPDAPADLAPKIAVPTLVVQHDQQRELLWTLRLAEYWGDRLGGYGYQPDADWTAPAASQLSYRDSAVSSRADIDGSCSCTVTAGADQLAFEISLTNRSTQPWPDCWAWLCLIHRWARAFQANCELPVGDAPHIWVPTSALDAPIERWLKWCLVTARRDVAERIARNQSTRWQPHILAREGAVRAWRVAGDPIEQQFIQMTSPDAILLGWSHWPCTDMGVYLGTLETGQTGTAAGQVTFFERSFVPI
jgi:hypothetical protein